MLSTKKININLPTSWDSCTTEQLETIASVLLRHVAAATIYTPFDLLACKTELFFALSGVKLLANLNPVVPTESQYYLCSYKGETFQLYLWQLEYWLGKGSVTLPNNHKVQQQHFLGFLEGPNAKFDGLTRFPYPVIKRGFWGKEFHGPEALMQNFSWQQYRFAQDWLDYHTRVSNHLLYQQKHRSSFSQKEIDKTVQNVDMARASFLATIFNGKVRGVDELSQKFYKAWEYRSNQHSENAKYFRHFDPVKFQVITFWWNGMMAYLQKQYPNMFKPASPESDTSNPLEVYVRTSATLEKYLGFTEKQINNQLFHVVLQHIDDMIKENKEMEKIRNK